MPLPTRPMLAATSPAASARLAEGFAAIRTELGVPTGFPADALAEAEAAAAASGDGRAGWRGDGRTDATGIGFVTIDPPGSVDLDQALHVERRTGQPGYRVRYAIADVAAFVAPGSGLDRESHARGETLYSPDQRTPLYPPQLSEGAASLLPDGPRPALLWTIDLDGDGEVDGVDVRRAVVRSRAQLDYPSVQRDLDAGTAPEPLALLAEVGRLRQARERDRGGVSLPVPQQEVDGDEQSGWRLVYRAPLPVEDWNAQISLLTGMCAARIMLDGGLGLLRTLPPPDPERVESLRRSALALGIDWPQGRPYADVVRSLDPREPAAAALLSLTTTLLRGAGYAAFDGAPPAAAVHSAVAAPYAHATAPLRRLADRYVGEACLALHAGAPVPAWARETLPALPAQMAAADARSHRLDRAAVDLAEAVVLQPYVGRDFPAVVVEADHHGGIVQLRDPAVRGRCRGDALPLGQEVRARLVSADPAQRRVEFATG
ncbi:MAG: RNB domain-containing ribonuclease [Frankiaceae bacterium]